MWMVVKQYVDHETQVDNIVNIDTIVRVSVSASGSRVSFIDGTAIDVIDPFKEIVDTVLKAQGK